MQKKNKRKDTSPLQKKVFPIKLHMKETYTSFQNPKTYHAKKREGAFTYTSIITFLLSCMPLPTDLIGFQLFQWGPR
jgi:hypothetical protein